MSDAMKTGKIDETLRYIYAEYLTWDGPERFQLINGEVFMMASPSVQHQRIQRELFGQFYNWLKGKPCEVFAAPLDVRLFPKNDLSDNTVVQPDLMVICQKEKIDKNSINGAPDLVIEILSPSNSAKELIYKFQYYQQSGVKEYWLVDPDEKKVQVQIFNNGGSKNTFYPEDDIIPVNVLPSLVINLKDIWAEAQ